MRVLVPGATGVAGRSTVPALLEAGHDVTGHARSEEKARALQDRGAVAVIMG